MTRNQIIILSIVIVVGLIAYYLYNKYYAAQSSKIAATSINPPPQQTVETDAKKILKPGDEVYMNPLLKDNELYVLNQPIPQNQYLIGSHHRDWGNDIGQVLEVAGTTGFVKVRVKDLQIYKYENGNFTKLDKLNGDFFVRQDQLLNTPY